MTDKKTGPTYQERKTAWVEAGARLSSIFDENRHDIVSMADRVNLQASIAEWLLGIKDA